jgi:5-methylthioadenosine/S-adenosylhomocysteine deaminase
VTVGRRILIRGGTVVTMDPRRSLIRDGAVVVEEGRIAFAGPRDEVPPGPPPDILDATGCIVMPGLVNCHTHLCMGFGRTVGTERDLLAWLDLEVPLIRALDREALFLVELLGCVENLKNGNTTVVDNIFTPHPPDFVPEAVALAAMERSGVRGVLARGFHGRNFAADFVETAAEQTERLRTLVAEWHGAADGRLRVSVSPLLPWVMTEELFRHTRRLSDELGIGIHMHVAETRRFNELIARHFGRPVRHVELLHEVGCLGGDVQAVGVADLSPREIERLAETGTPVVFDPPTRLFWGSGYPSLVPFLEAGLTCGLATNGPAANCGQDIFESMKYACAVAKTATGNPTALTRHRALAMATIEGARVLGLQDLVGSLEPGKRADLITVDCRQPHLTPALDVEAALVYSARGSDVRDVMVDGHLVVRGRRVLTVDEADLLREATAAARRCARAAGIDLGRDGGF